MGSENTQRNLLDLSAGYSFLLPLAKATTEVQDPLSILMQNLKYRKEKEEKSSLGLVEGEGCSLISFIGALEKQLIFFYVSLQLYNSHLFRICVLSLLLFLLIFLCCF